MDKTIIKVFSKDILCIRLTMAPFLSSCWLKAVEWNGGHLSPQFCGLNVGCLFYTVECRDGARMYFPI